MERRIRELHRRVRDAREQLAVLDEQIEVLAEEAEDLRVRWLVAETPLSERESADAQRHLELAQRAASDLRAEIAQCTEERDRLLRELPVGSRT
jgi:predicted  nucleic acid-binding Zn-ribbon protein